MKVILSQDVPTIGKIGDVVTVKEGFARNCLIPQKKAYLATADNLKRIDQIKAKQKLEADRIKQEAEEYAKKLSAVSCTVSVEVNDLEKLYGAVSETDIIKALKEEGFDIDKKTLVIDKPLEELGIFEIGVKVHAEVIAKIKIWVTKK
ncbi:MAG: 50S ribosomal protein L9 [Candidatus Omnitrophota bacterium]|jgi:large subunit ribosomal protein L9